MAYFIYSITDPRTDTVFYVGRTKDINQRISSHLSSNHKCVEIEKAGFKSLFKVVFKCSSKYADVYEKIFIEYYESIGYHLDNVVCVNRRRKKDKVFTLTSL